MFKPKTKIEIIEELKVLKVEFDEKATVPVLLELLKKNTPTEGAKGDKPLVTGQTEIKAGSVLVWLKCRSYLNDEQRVNAGIYSLVKCPVRLSKLPITECEVLGDEVNSRKIAEIARWAGMNPDGMSDEEILSKVISPELVPFS